MKNKTVMTLSACLVIGLGCSVGSKIGLGDNGTSGTGAGPTAVGDETPKERRLNKEFTEVLEGTGETCSKMSGKSIAFAGKMKTKELSPSQCGNIADGLRYVCQDNKDSADDLVKTIAKLDEVHCEYADAKSQTASVVVDGSIIRVKTNIDMADPSEKVRCQIAKKFGLDYKGDLDDACVKRSYK